MKLFEKIFNVLLAEDIAAGVDGAFGSADSMGHGGSFPGSSDFYAPGDARNPTFLGARKIKKKKRKSSKRKRKSSKRKRKSSKKKAKKNVVTSSYIPIQRRTFAPLMANISGMQGPSLKRNHGSV
mgnify:CR=1 FL=1|jgi:hypothetical protein